MTQQEALSALFNNAARRPVDVNLGQVPLTPTIGRMGNYNVVVRDTPRDNSALELSRALSQLPQLLGQARNISAASGARQAEEITLEELETKVKNGDADAKGTMTWLGADKAYQELAYKRLADANITPTLTNISSEIDRMSHAELLKFNSPDDIKDHVQGRLVGSLDPGIMETIKGKPWMEIRHNRYMEAIVPEYVEKVNASIEGRKHEFKIKEAIAALETNFLAQSSGGIPTQAPLTEDFEFPDDAGDDGREFYTLDPDTAGKMYINNFQYALDFARSQGEASGLDRFQIEDTLIPALTAKYNMLVEDEHHSEADLLLEAMESGSLKINGRPINKSSAGMRLMQNAEARLERSLEADEDKIDTEKMDSHQSDLLSMIAAEKVKPGYDPDTFAGSLQEMEDEVLNDPTKKWNDKEKIQLSNIYARARDGLYGRGEIHAETSDEKREELGEEITKKFNLSAREQSDMTTNLDIIESATIDTGASLSDYKNYITKEVNDGVNPVYQEFRDPILKILTANALQQAVKETVGSVVDLPENELFLGTYKTDEEQKNQSLFRNGLQNTLQERYKRNVGLYFKDYIDRIKSQNPPLSPEEAQKREMDSVAVKQKRRAYRRMLESGETLTDENGNIKPSVRNKTEVFLKGSLLTDEDKDFYYALPPANATFNNEMGRIEFKSAPVKSRLTALRGLASEASNLDRVTSVAEDIESVVGQDQEGVLYDKELDLVRHSGLPLNTLLKDGVSREISTKTGGIPLGWPFGDARFFDEDTTVAIVYNKYGHFNDPTETTKRIFNLDAVIKYIQDDNDKYFIRIHDKLLKDKMPLKDFINNQVTFFESFAGDITNAKNPQQNNK